MAFKTEPRLGEASGFGGRLGLGALVSGGVFGFVSGRLRGGPTLGGSQGGQPAEVMDAGEVEGQHLPQGHRFHFVQTTHQELSQAAVAEDRIRELRQAGPQFVDCWGGLRSPCAVARRR